MVYLFLSPWILWSIYTATMRLKQVRDAGSLTLAMKVLGYPLLAVGLTLDFILNATLGSLLFLEIPHEYTLSERLWRHSNESAGYRHKWALWLRVNLLDAIDPAGIHRG